MAILLIQYRTDASQAHEQRCVLAHSGLQPSELVVANPILQPGSVSALKVNEFDGILIGGSGEFQLSQPDPRIMTALDEVRFVIDDALSQDKFMLGMCFGHQLIAWHLGVSVHANPEESQVGSFEVTLTADGSIDPIFDGVPIRFTAQHGHKDSIAGLPVGARHLAQGPRHAYNGFRVGKTYGLQFHPELTLDDLIARLQLYPEYLKGRTIEEARQDYRPSPSAPRILKNFIGLTQQATQRVAQVPTAVLG